LQGILVFVPACLPKKATKEENFHTLVRLWIHEAARVFSDRLTEAETTQFNDALKDIVESEFKLNKQRWKYYRRVQQANRVRARRPRFVKDKLAWLMLNRKRETVLWKE
jgi:hypothetical protein